MDESGDLGWKFDRPYLKCGSSRFFTISIIVVHQNDKHRLERAVKGFRKKLERKHDIIIPVSHEIKASDLKPGERELFARELLKEVNKTKKFFKVYSKTVKKENVEKFSFKLHPNVLYNYMTGLAFLEEIKDLHQVTLIADKRITSVEAQYGFVEYLQTKLSGDLNSETILNVSHKDSKDSRHLQCVDLVANIIWRKYEFCKYDAYNILSSNVKDRTLYF